MTQRVSLAVGRDLGHLIGEVGAQISLGRCMPLEAVPILRVPDARFLLNIARSELPETFLLVVGILESTIIKIFVGAEVHMGSRLPEKVSVLFLDVDCGVDETAVARD